jgi:hypothetical protein
MDVTLVAVNLLPWITLVLAVVAVINAVRIRMGHAIHAGRPVPGLRNEVGMRGDAKAAR